MTKRSHFKEWLSLNESGGGMRAAGKQSLYPDAYTLATLYPSSVVINWSADAITYMPKEEARLKFIWGKGMLSDPQAGG